MAREPQAASFSHDAPTPARSENRGVCAEAADDVRSSRRRASEECAGIPRRLRVVAWPARIENQTENQTKGKAAQECGLPNQSICGEPPRSMAVLFGW